MRRNRTRRKRPRAENKNFSLSQSIQLFGISNLGWLLIKILGPTYRYEVIGTDYFAEGPRPAIYSFWHNQIVCAVYYYQKQRIVVLTSQHFDGEYIARVIEKFGYLSARGSSTRGAVRGLLELIDRLNDGRDVAFTIDGPKGPRYRVKPGPLFLAQKTGLPVVPFHVEPKKYWELKSWDRLRIPKPFSRIAIKLGPPFYVPDDYDEEEYMGRFQSAMDELTKECSRYFNA